jgi:hypothetical protein
MMEIKLRINRAHLLQRLPHLSASSSSQRRLDKIVLADLCPILAP